MNFKTKMLYKIYTLLIFSLFFPHYIHSKEIAKDVQLHDGSALITHPVYSKYNFHKNKIAINIGIQPFNYPTGQIFESVRRDKILRSELESLGVELNFYNFLKGDDVNFFIKKGDLDGGVGGDMPALTMADEKDILITSIVQMGNSAIVAREGIWIENLAGKKIGYPYGSSAHYTLLKALADEGIDESKVELIPMDIDKMTEALSAGTIDAFSAWEPTPTLSLILNKKNEVIHRSLNTSYLYFTKSMFEKYPEAAIKITASVMRSINWLKNDQENLLAASQWTIHQSEPLRAGIMSNLTKELSANLAIRDIIGLIKIPSLSKSSLREGAILHKEFLFLKKIGRLSKSSSWERIKNNFNPEIMDKIKADPVKYKINEFNYLN